MYSVFLFLLVPTYCFVFIIFSARCKILFRVDTPWKSLCGSISTWYTEHNLYMGNSYIQYIASNFVQISYFLLYLLTDYRPEYIFVYFLISHVMSWVKNEAIFLLLLLLLLYNPHSCIYIAYFLILYTIWYFTSISFRKNSNYDQEIQSHTVNQTTAMWGRATEHW